MEVSEVLTEVTTDCLNDLLVSEFNNINTFMVINIALLVILIVISLFILFFLCFRAGGFN